MELKWKTCVRAGITVVVLFLIMHYWAAFTGVANVALGAAKPLFWGCAIAYVVNIPMRFLERYVEPKCKKETVRKMCRPICMVLAFVCIFFDCSIDCPDDCARVNWMSANFTGRIARRFG